MTQNPAPLNGKCGLITGAAHRIGAAIARTLHAEGTDLVLHYRSSSTAAEALEHELETQRPGSIKLLQTDPRETSGFDQLITETSAHRGRLDLLANNECLQLLSDTPGRGDGN